MNSLIDPHSPNPASEPPRMPPREAAKGSASSAVPRGSFWSRYGTVINFWLDAVLLVLFMAMAWMFAVLHAVFPRGAGPEWTIWGATPLDWSETLFTTFCVFSVGIVLHVMFHWAWICGVVSTRFLGRKPGKDDGSQTLIGVGFLVLLVHLLALGVLVTRVGLTPPR